MAALDSLTIKTAEEHRNDFLRTLRVGLIRAGVTNPNVAPGSDYYLLGQALGEELAAIGAGAVAALDAVMPDSAVEDELDRWLASVGLTRRPAAISEGGIVFDASTAVLIATGTELLSGAGLRYEVTVGGSYSDGDTIPIASIDTGTAANLDEGDTLRWVATPPFAAPTALVAVGGTTGAADAEDDETARRRLLRRLANPPKSGNWSHVAEVAEASTPVVQAAFVYPAAQGPGTCHVAVTAYPSDTNKTRQLGATTVSTLVEPYIVGNMPEHTAYTITTVTDVSTDVAIALALPAAPTASIPGPGGGWLDGTTWPKPEPTDPLTQYCNVTNVTSTTSFRVRASQAPTANSTRICWLSPTDWKLYSATVLTQSTASTYEFNITIDVPFVGIAVGCFISPQSVRQADYFAALLDQFRLMGPGEKTSDLAVYARAYRHPVPQSAWPYSLGSVQLRAISDAGDEVLDVQYLYPPVGAGRTPAVPGAITSAPNILKPRHLGFYELTS